MKKINSEILYFLRKDAKMIKDVRANVKDAKERYKPDVAANVVSKQIAEIKELRESYKKSISNLIETELKTIKEKHENQYRSDGHQATISNILKMLELRDFNINEEQFKNLVAPLIKADDYITLDMIGDIMNEKGKCELSEYCKQNANNNEVEITGKMFNSINEYINTDIVTSVGGDPIKFKNSSYEEICLLAENLGFDVTDMGKEYGGNDVLVEPSAFLDRQIGTAMGVKVDEPLFNIK